ncbi:hypothetical protein M422DRAFT_36392 [Sphaerobolus stellatus SS14]|uniref:Uncharacterized protein n=1 Tax=Sphaerobolus stellatus (strain SS14) TaxID=990650 RepID=A0A0C9UPG1_SPHS4|nr:hypothetical protein M422DRAFT_36392 [Sphaerobolus stellatus SS14]
MPSLHLTSITNSIHGYCLNLGACVLVWILIAAQVKYIYWENARRDRGERDYRISHGELPVFEAFVYTFHTRTSNTTSSLVPNHLSKYVEKIVIALFIVAFSSLP